MYNLVNWASLCPCPSSCVRGKEAVWATRKLTFNERKHESLVTFEICPIHRRRKAYRNIQFLACYMALVTNPTRCLSLKVLSSSGSPEAAEYEQIRRGRRFHDPLLPFWVFLYKCQLHFLSPTRKQSRITIALRTIRQRSFVLTRPKVNRPDHGHNWFLKSPYSLFS